MESALANGREDHAGGVLAIAQPSQAPSGAEERTFLQTHKIQPCLSFDTQAEEAARVGLTRQSIIAIEQGKYSPSLEVAFRIARAFNARIDDVFHYPAAEDV